MTSKLDLIPTPVRNLASRFRHHEEPELRVVRRMVKAQGGTAFDVGANWGMYTLFLLGAADRVVAFEPIPDLARSIARRYGVEVEAKAVSNREGSLTLRIPIIDGHEIGVLATVAEANQFLPAQRRGALNGVKEIQVPVTTIDAFAGGRIDDLTFLKIDVEGHEYEVLEGAMETIRAQRPAIMVEIELRHGARPDRIFDLLSGYSPRYFDGRKLVPVASHDVQALQQSRANYVNNFFFMP